MARRRSVTVAAQPPLADGPIAEATRSLWHNRFTSYQSHCLRLGELAIDLPTPRFAAWHRGSGELYRHTERYPSGRDLMSWVLDVAAQNVLAGVVLIDALDWYGDLLRFAIPTHSSRFPERENKKEWTEGVGEYLVEFEVPTGWEFEFRDVVHTAGHRGVASVTRCHLSDNWYHSNYGFGRLVGGNGLEVEGAIGFTIPCEYVSALRVEGETLHVDRADPDPSHGYGINLPYAFVLRAFRRPWNREKKLAFVMRPTDAELIALARRSVTRVQESWKEKIASHKS
jgi:hypothetical protein